MVALQQHPPILLQRLGVGGESLMRMKLVVAQMAHQRRLVLDFPIAVFPFDETEMLCGALQYGLAAPLDPLSDPVGVDVGDRTGKIDMRAPGGERGEQRQPAKVPAIALGGSAGEKAALSVRGLGDPTGDGEARSKPLHVHSKGAGIVSSKSLTSK